MTNNAALFAWPGRILRRHRVGRMVPFARLAVLARRVVALTAIARPETNRNQIGITQRLGVLAARPMAAFALHVGKLLQRRRHSRPISICYGCWNGPAKLGGDIVESAVDDIRVGIVADGVALQTGLAIQRPYSQVAVNAFSENAGMCGGLPGWYHVRGNDPAAVAQSAGVNPYICSGRNRENKVGRSFTSGRYSGKNRVFAGQVWPQKRSPGHLIQQLIGWFKDGYIRAQRATG